MGLAIFYSLDESNEVFQKEDLTASNNFSVKQVFLIKSQVNLLYSRFLCATTRMQCGMFCRGNWQLCCNAHFNALPYLFAYKPILATSRDPKLVTQNTDSMLTKNSGKSRL